MAFTLNTDNGRETLTHYINLGDKNPDANLYNHVSWADVAINGVDLATTMDHEMSCMSIESQKKNADLMYTGGGIEVQPRKMDNQILESSSGEKEFEKGSGLKKIYIRKRTIPQGVRKKFPTKPKNQSKQEKVKNALEKVTDEIERDDTPVGQIPSMITEKSIIDGWFNYGGEMEDIPDQLVLSKDHVMVDGSPKWCFHSMKTGEEFCMDYEASIRDVYHKWMKDQANL
jgi:hypothetical protein